MNSIHLHRVFVLTSLAMAALSAHAVTVPPSAFSALYVFGDSLSDSGNNNLVFGGQTGPAPSSGTFIPSLPYAASPPGAYRPTYSNGPTWVTSFAAGLGLSPFSAPSLAGGGNYAYGGARMTVDGTGVPPFIPAPFPASLQTQLNGYLAARPVSSTALYVIAGGGNDVRAVGDAVAANPTNIGALTTAGATAFATSARQMVNTLRGAGAMNVVVWNVPDVGKSPAAGAGVGPAAGAASFISGAFNTALSQSLVGSGAILFDVNALIGNILANQATFGMTNVTQACGFVGNSCNPSTALFWDGIHPTAYTQTIVGGAMLAAVPEPSSMLMLAVGICALVAWRRRA